jgi:two-component system NtrC family sensor kinase
LATDAILVFDLEGNIVYASEAACQHRGYTREEMTKMNLRQVVAPERIPFIIPRMNEVRKKGRAFFEIAHLHKDGSRIQVESHIRFIRSGEREFVLSVSRDITGRKRTEEERRKAEEKLRLIFNSVTDGIVVTDLKGRLTEVNKVAVNMHGFENEADLVSQRALELISRRDHAGVLENLKETLRAGYSGVMEYSLLSRDGGEFLAELSISVLRDERSNPVGFVALIRDITERKRREQQLLLTDRLASIGELVSGIAHELNNPLTGIVGFSQLLLRGNIPENIRGDITTIYNESQRAVRIVRSLLNFARKHEPVKQLVNVNTIVENVLELRSYEHRVHNILVEKKMARELPGILADSSLLQQVFFNIVINAEHSMIAAHQRGKLVIITDKVGNMLRISFADDGLGISKENQECIFNSFFTTKEAGKGTGLGLSICRSIVTRHGGRIYVESELGKGSNFIVELPFHR